jgi:DNA-binding NtrC family response regulator
MIDSPIRDTFEAQITDDEQNDPQETSPTRRAAACQTDIDLMGRSQAASDASDADEWVPLSVIEGRYVAKVLAHTRGNKQAAARVLGVDRKTLDRMIKRHNIETDSLRPRSKPPDPPVNSMTHH